MASCGLCAPRSLDRRSMAGQHVNQRHVSGSLPPLQFPRSPLHIGQDPGSDRRTSCQIKETFSLCESESDRTQHGRSASGASPVSDTPLFFLLVPSRSRMARSWNRTSLPRETPFERTSQSLNSSVDTRVVDMSNMSDEYEYAKLARHYLSHHARFTNMTSDLQ